MAVTLEQGEALGAIDFKGAIDISCAAELKGILLKALESEHDIHVSLAHATSLDVTAVQLLWAAKREAKKSGIEFEFSGRISKDISAALENAGLEKFSAI